MKRKYTEEEIADIFKPEMDEVKDDIIEALTTPVNHPMRQPAVYLICVYDLATDKTTLFAGEKQIHCFKKFRAMLKQIDNDNARAKGMRVIEPQLREIIDTNKWFSWSIGRINANLVDIEIGLYSVDITDFTVLDLSLWS